MSARPLTPLDEAAVVWSHREEERGGRPLVVLMHGFYGHESDWSAWFGELPDGTVGASLRAPVPIGERWAWVDFDQPGMTTSRMVAAYSAVARGVHAWVEQQHAPRVALVGWSQGGAVAAHLLRQHPDRYASAALVAGFVADVRPHAGVRSRRPPVWYGLGEHDDVITPGMAERSRRWLTEHTDATLATLPGEDHMLTPTFVQGALGFTARTLTG